MKDGKSVNVKTENVSESKKTQKRGHKRLKLHHYVMAVLVIIMITIIVISGGLNAILRWALANPIKIPDVIWIIVISVVSSVITYLVMKKFIVSPLSKLESAMTKVSEGDFNVRLETNSRIEEIKKSYDSFNIMVKELRSTETLQQDFVANVSHEFKTPINAIEGYATLLQGANLDEEETEYVSKILFGTKKLSELTESILLLSKIENQSIVVKNEKIRLDEQIRQAVVFLESKWEQKRLDFDANLEEIYYYGNENLLFRVWVNLIDNAVKFSHVGGIISLELVSFDGFVRFTVTDEGPGVSDEAKKHVFDKFYQADDSHFSQGNGLGLTLVKRILSTQNGFAEVSDNPGGGAKFTVKLPLEKNE